MTAAPLSIGDVARRAGIAPSAVRYYERRGLLPQPERLGGRRRYTEATVRRLGVIAVAKEAGFTLDEVRTLLDGAPAGERLRALAERKLPDVEALIARAEAMRGWLEHARHCTCATLEACPLFGVAPGEPSAPVP